MPVPLGYRAGAPRRELFLQYTSRTMQLPIALEILNIENRLIMDTQLQPYLLAIDPSATTFI
jgi:hypothetical protein